MELDKQQYESLVEDVKVLLKRSARGKPPKVSLSRETADLLESITAESVRTKQHPLEEQHIFVAQTSDEPVAADIISPTSAGAGGESGPQTGDSLSAIIQEISTCEKCPLARTRKNTVPGEGNPRAELVFVGEAPGASEDEQGRPFVGRAGKLLTDIITKGMKMNREDVFICNVLKCRPPENRTPNPEEVMHCEPYLLQQLDVIRPKVICALGTVAAQTLLKTTAPLYKLRGIWHNYHGIPFRVTYHPAYLLRNPADKAKTWEDIQEVLRCLRGEVIPDIDRQ